MVDLPQNLPGEELARKIWTTVVDKGVGGLLGPWQRRRLGQADRDNMRADVLAAAQAERDAKDVLAGRKTFTSKNELIDIDLDRPALSIDGHSDVTPYASPDDVLKYVEDDRKGRALLRAANLAQIILKAEDAASQTRDDETVSDQEVDDTWFARWRDGAEDVSTEELQELWAKVLAGEVKQPGSFSLHTVDFLRRLSKEDAEDLQRVAPFVINNWIYNHSDEQWNDFGLGFTDLLALVEVGILSSNLHVTLRSATTGRFVAPFTANGKVIVFVGDDEKAIFDFGAYVLTRVGREVLSLGTFQPNVEYLKMIAAAAAKKGLQTKYGDRVDYSMGTFRLENEVDLGPKGDGADSPSS